MKSVLGFMFSEARIIVVVILVAIVFPSIMLSVFAIWAIGTERSHVQDGIRKEADSLRDRTVASVLSRLTSARALITKKNPNVKSPERMRELLENLRSSVPCFTQIVVLDRLRNIVYPFLPRKETLLALGTSPTGLYEALQKARSFEFVHADFIEAEKSYLEVFESADNDRLRVSALFGLARVRAREGKNREAIETYERIGAMFGSIRDENGLLAGPAALLRIAEIQLQSGNLQELYERVLTACDSVKKNRSLLTEEEAEFFDVRLNLLIDGYINKTAEGSGRPDMLLKLRDEITERKKIEAVAWTVKDEFLRRESSENAGITEIELSGARYLAVSSLTDAQDSQYILFAIAPWQQVRANLIEPLVEKIAMRDEIGLAIVGTEGGLVVGEMPPDSVFMLGSSNFPDPLSELQVKTYLKGYESLDSLSSIRTNIYVWAVGLAITGIVAGAIVTFLSVRKTMRAAELKSDFVSNVTHELKTPLTSIRMFAETLHDGRVRDEKDAKECLETIVSESERLTRLIDKVLDFRAIEKGRRKFDFKVCDPKEVILSSLETFRRQMRGCEATIYANLPDALPHVRIDPDAMQELLLNLLNNAYKYSRPDERKIWVSARIADATMEISVRDSGIGIPKRARKAIFEKFYRVNDLLTREVDGTGLGLTISRHIAQAHGGELKVASTEGEGSEFTIVLKVPE